MVIQSASVYKRVTEFSICVRTRQRCANPRWGVLVVRGEGARGGLVFPAKAVKAETGVGGGGAFRVNWGKTWGVVVEIVVGVGNLGPWAQTGGPAGFGGQVQAAIMLLRKKPNQDSLYQTDHATSLTNEATSLKNTPDNMPQSGKPEQEYISHPPDPGASNNNDNSTSWADDDPVTVLLWYCQQTYTPPRHLGSGDHLCQTVAR